MENHPIPQDITGFQFKLIGDMTIKQFGYLALGAIVGWFVFSLSISIIIRLPLALLIAAGGASLAFFPVGGRPLDVMVYNYIRALFSPNQYVFQKVGGHLAILTVAPTKQQSTKPSEKKHNRAEELRMFVGTGYSSQPKNKLDEKEAGFFKLLSNLPSAVKPSLPSLSLSQTSAPSPSHQGTSLPGGGTATLGGAPGNPKIITMMQDQTGMPPINKSIEKNKKDEQKPEQQVQETEKKLTEEVQALKHELDEAKKQEAQQVTPGMAHQKVLDLEQQLQEIMAQKADLEKQLVAMAQKLQNQNTPVFTPSAAPQAQQQTVHVRSISKDMGAKVGLPIAPEFPNLLVGIVKDPRQNILTNILIEVKDQDGNPVRALKTNALGQFATATPLLNGVYTISFEDPNNKHTFDTVQIQAAGEVIPPIEVISTDAREELRKDLFGT